MYYRIRTEEDITHLVTITRRQRRWACIGQAIVILLPLIVVTIFWFTR